jgi:MFS family permease
MLPAAQWVQSSAASGFSTSSADIIRSHGYKEAVTGYLSSGQKILLTVLLPIISPLVDAFGHRFPIVALAPLLWITVCVLLAFMSLQPLGDQTKIGTAFSVWRAFNNAGSTIVDNAFGVQQDNTVGSGYDRVFKLAMRTKEWAFFLRSVYIFEDWRLFVSASTITRKGRKYRLAEIEEPKITS